MDLCQQILINVIYYGKQDGHMDTCDHFLQRFSVVRKAFGVVKMADEVSLRIPNESTLSISTF